MRADHRSSRILAILLLASSFAIVPPVTANAASITTDFIPSLRLQEEWQSNVFDSRTNEVSSFGTRLTPGAALRFTSPDNVILQLSGKYEKVWFYSSEAKEADYNTWFFRVDSTGGWKLTPSLSMLPSVYYVNTSNSYQRTRLVPSGDPVAPPVSITNFGKTKTQEFGGGLGFDYLATPNLTVGVVGRYSEQRFSGDNASITGLTDSTQAGGSASVSYLFSQRTSLGFTAGGDHQTYKDNPSTDTLSGSLTVGHQISPAFRFDGTLGISHIRQKEAQGAPAQQDTSPSGNFNITYTRVTFAARAFGSYVYSGSTGFGQATRQWTTGISLSDKLAREWGWNLSGTYQVSRSVFESGAVDLSAFYGSGSLLYQPLEWATLDLTGNMSRQRSSGQFGDTLNNYSAILGVTMGKPYKLY